MEEINEVNNKAKHGDYKFFIGMLAGVTTMVIIFFAIHLLVPGLLSGGHNAPLSSRGTPIERKVNEVLHLLDTVYIGEIERQHLIDNMFRGLVFGVGDPYTVYMTAEEFEIYRQGTDGSFAGIGVNVAVNMEDNTIEIIAPHEGSPAANAGLLPRDRIVGVNGYSVNGDMLQQAITMIRGVPGTTVTLTILRGSETFNVDIVRANVEVQTVVHEMLPDNVGYIRISQFAQVTDEQFFVALNDLKQQDLRGLIIDLRNNPGGRLDTVLSITNALVPEGVIMYMETKAGPTEYHYADSEYLGVPLLILINDNSASASEVLAGAVRDTGVGQLVGTTTFGKGVVQNIFTLSCGTGVVKVTIARYYTPSGVTIHDVGIEPHFMVEMDSVAIAGLDRAEDVQLQAAIEIMGGKIR